MGRRWRGRDEEQLPGVRKMQVLVPGRNVGGLTEIHLDTLAHDCFAVEDLPDSDGGVLVKEGDYNAAEGLERCPRVNLRRGIDKVFDGLQIVCAEDLHILEVGDEEGI